MCEISTSKPHFAPTERNHLTGTVTINIRFLRNLIPATSKPSKYDSAQAVRTTCILFRPHLISFCCRPFIDAHVIDQHLLRKNCRCIRSSRPVAPHCHVQNNKERMIEDPRGARGQICGRARLIQVSVDVKSHDFGLPFKGERMEVIRELLPAR